MTRRPWFGALSAALTAAGLSGCLSGTAFKDGAEKPRYFQPAPAPRGPHAQPTIARATGGASSEGAVRQAAAVEPAQEPEPPPAPVPLPQPEVKLVAAGPARSDAPLVTALRALLEKHPPEEAVALLQTYDPGQQKLLSDLLALAASLADGGLTRARPSDVAALLDRLEALEQALRPRAALVMEKLCFCSAIDNFGLYVPLGDGHGFRAPGAGQPGERVQVYAEVRNFTSQPVRDQFETKLKGTLEIHDGKSGRPLVSYDLSCTDRSRTPRRDFFVNFHFDVPARLPPGSYTLWVHIKDVTPGPDGSPQAPRAARRSLDFRVVGDATPGESVGTRAP